MKADLQVKLLFRKPAMADCKVLVDKFDCEDRLRSMQRRCLLDAEQRPYVSLCMDEEDQPTMHRRPDRWF